MKKTFILLIGIVVFSLSGLVGQSSAHEKFSYNQLLIIQENDPGLEIEDWMVDGKIWNENKSISVVEEQDCELELESWMIQGSMWN